MMNKEIIIKLHYIYNEIIFGLIFLLLHDLGRNSLPILRLNLVDHERFCN